MMRGTDRRGATGTTSDSAARRGMSGRVLAVVVATSATVAAWPAAAPASHPPYPDSPFGTAQAGMTLRTSEPFCGAPYGPQSTPSQLGTHGGDMAFWGSRAVLACGADDDDVGNDGFVTLDITDPAHPVKLGEMRCVASASDIAIWDDLVFLAVDRNSEAGDYTQPGPSGTSCTEIYNDFPRDAAKTFAGVRIVSIADPTAPRIEKNVATNSPLGAHNITVVPDLDFSKHGAKQPRVLVYAATPRSNRQDVVAVPLKAPEEAKVEADAVIETPGLRVHDNPSPGVLPEVESRVPDTNGCHDISFFLPRGLATCHAITALGTHLSGTIIWDVRDDRDDPRDDGASPLTPKVVSQITSATEGFPRRRDHSSAFSWDGGTLVISDENLTGLATQRCDADSVLWFYDISEPHKPVFRGKQEAHPFPGTAWCPSKQISVVPLLDGRDVLIASWLGGGTTVVDFTDPAAPRQIGVFADYTGSSDTPADDVSAAWSSYWYADRVFVNNAWGCARKGVCFGSKLRGLDVLTLQGIKASDTARLPRFNFGTQECLPPLHSRGSCG